MHDDLIRAFAGDEALTRGRDYFADGSVFDVAWEDEEDGTLRLTGKVEGAELYEAEATLSAKRNAIVSASCSKPLDEDGQCPHVAAVVLAGEALGAFVAAAPDRRSAMEQTIREAAARRKIPLTADEVEALSGRLMKLKVGVGESPSGQNTRPGRPPRAETFDLDHMAAKATYRRATDTLSIVAEAVYGPLRFPLLDRVLPNAQTLDQDGRERHVQADRDDAAELELSSLLGSYLTRTPNGAEWTVSGDGIYQAAVHLLPELEFRAQLEVDASVEPLLRRETAEMTSDWTARHRGAGIDWLDFSVAWHCQNAQLSPEEVERLITEGKPYVRAADGSFIEIANREDIAELLAFLKESTERTADGYAAKSFFAPELLHLMAKRRGAKLAETDASFQRLMEDARSGRIQEPVVLPPHLDSVLRGYQKDGVAWMRFLRAYGFGGVLADDMGLGKTVQVLAALSALKAAPEGETRGPSLVVCPKTLLLTWKQEAQKFTPELRTVVVDGLPAEREKAIAGLGDADLAITSYSLLQRDAGSYLKNGTAFQYVILDEAQAVKNATTATAQAVKLLPGRWRLALTGTPLENGVHELWSVFDFLMPGFLGDRKAFKSRYERPIAERQDAAKLEMLREKVRPFMLRRTKASHLADLPPKIEQTRPCTLAPEQVIVYARALEDARARVQRAVQLNGFQRSRIEILSSLMKLRRICDHPALEDPRLPRTEELSGKMAHALELVREAADGGHKVLLFSQFTGMLDILREALTADGIGSCTIEGKTRDRQAEIDRFNTDPKSNVFLLSLKAGGTGLTLTAADTVILYDPWWNPQVERQAMDRAHRIGQTKSVNVYKLVTQNAVEEKVVALQERKQAIFDAIMQENAEAMAALTWEDVRALFS